MKRVKAKLHVDSWTDRQFGRLTNPGYRVQRTMFKLTGGRDAGKRLYGFITESTVCRDFVIAAGSIAELVEKMEKHLGKEVEVLVDGRPHQFRQQPELFDEVAA